MTEFEKAKKLSRKAHRNQKYGIFPYIKHIDDVQKVLQRFGISDETILIAAELHDTVEDTYVTLEDIRKAFGEEIANIVHCVTNEEGINREERNKKTYPKIRGNLSATIVKLADRIANVEESIRTQGNLLAVYRREFNGFKAGIKIDGMSQTCDRMWEHLELLLSDD